MLTTFLLLQATLPAPSWVRPPVPLGPGIEETSGLVASARYPGVLWTLNDSDNPPVLFAIDTAGRTVASVPVPGARNYDWEALASGPCPSARTDGRTCLYIGDIGDNRRERPHLTVYRVLEPDPATDSVAVILDSLQIAYPDGPRDAESMVVSGTGSIWIVSKERLREPRLYRVLASAWRSSRIAKARSFGALPIPSAAGVESWTTDATWADEGRALVIRTYGGIWRLPFVSGTPRNAETRLLCSVAGLGPQGEGIAALGDGYYAISSEKVLATGASVAVIRCGG